MRVIKFRAWDKASKKMLDRVLVGPGDPCSIVWDSERKEWLQFDEACGDIMQFTGVLDKHGQEIYEGDIVRHGNAVTDIVEYIEGGFVLCIQRLSDVPRKEVIGNIYEHRERISECAQARRRSIHDGESEVQ